MSFSNAAQQQRDLDGLRINPATEDKQDTIIALLNGSTGNYAERMEVDSTDIDVYYFGKAPIGSLTNAPVWQISKVDFSNGELVETWPGTDQFNQIWDNREALTYA